MLCAFDLVRREQIEERKRLLAKLLRGSHLSIVLNEHFEEDGAAVYRAACELGCEGIVSKRIAVFSVGVLPAGPTAATWQISHLDSDDRSLSAMSGPGLQGWGAMEWKPGPLTTPNTTRRATDSTNEPRSAFLSMMGDQARGGREVAGGINHYCLFLAAGGGGAGRTSAHGSEVFFSASGHP